jgi:hypothetical protein
MKPCRASVENAHSTDWSKFELPPRSHAQLQFCLNRCARQLRSRPRTLSLRGTHDCAQTLGFFEHAGSALARQTLSAAHMPLAQIPDQLAPGCVKTTDPIACFLVRTHQRRSHTTHPRQRSSTHSTKSSRTRVSVSLPDPCTSSLASCETANFRGRPAGFTVGYSPARPCTKGSLFLALSPKQPQGQDPLVENGHLVNWKASPCTFIP